QAQPQQPPFAPQAQPQQPPFVSQAPSQAQAFAAQGASKPPGSPSVKMAAPGAHGPAGTVPVGPNGVPRLESEIGVHSETNFYTDFLGDIRNNGGIFVATFHVLPVGAQCEVSLTFPGNLVTEFRGVVRWKRESAPGASLAASPGVGIEIVQADAAAWDLITRFIRKREPIMHEM
ncbi:MAG: PilZ domain-containing protein, partial [Deltaproteobacteria bacterium]